MSIKKQGYTRYTDAGRGCVEFRKSTQLEMKQSWLIDKDKWVHVKPAVCIEA